jgi:hypothetical protein
MGKLMKKIAGVRYTWKVICKKYNFLIQTALYTNEKNSIISSYSNLAQEDLALYNLEHLKFADMFYNRRKSA